MYYNLFTLKNYNWKGVDSNLFAFVASLYVQNIYVKKMHRPCLFDKKHVSPVSRSNNWHSPSDIYILIGHWGQGLVNEKYLQFMKFKM